jgi:hypothetical protein
MRPWVCSLASSRAPCVLHHAVPCSAPRPIYPCTRRRILHRAVPCSTPRPITVSYTTPCPDARLPLCPPSFAQPPGADAPSLSDLVVGREAHAELLQAPPPQRRRKHLEHLPPHASEAGSARLPVPPQGPGGGCGMASSWHGPALCSGPHSLVAAERRTLHLHCATRPFVQPAPAPAGAGAGAPAATAAAA